MTHMDFLGFSFFHIVTSISLSNIFLGNRVWIIPVHWVQKIWMHLDSARWISLKTQETTNYSGLQPRHNANLVNIGTLRSTKNGLLLCVQFVFTTLNNSFLFLVPVRELSRELRVINYNLRKFVGMTNLPFREEVFGSCALKVYEHRSTHGRKQDIYSPLVSCTSKLIIWKLSENLWTRALDFKIQVKQTEEKITGLFDYFKAVDTEWNNSVLYLRICLSLL